MTILKLLSNCSTICINHVTETGKAENHEIDQRMY